MPAAMPDVGDVPLHCFPRVQSHVLRLVAGPTWAHRSCVVGGERLFFDFDIRVITWDDVGATGLASGEFGTR